MRVRIQIFHILCVQYHDAQAVAVFGKHVLITSATGGNKP
jgi:hypothetical protein